MLCEMLTALFRILTRLTESTSYDDNRYTSSSERVDMALKLMDDSIRLILDI